MADGENLSAEQNEKLAYFQEITHIESIDECKQILEAFEWNMESAVQNTFNDQPMSSSASFGLNSDLDNGQNLVHPSDQSASTSGGQAADSAATSLSSSSSSSSSLSPPRIPTSSSSSSMHNQSLIYERFAAASTNNVLTRNNQSLPNVNIITQRTLSYSSNRQATLVPRGFVQWSVFIVSFPFKFLMSTLLDLFSFFWSFVNNSNAIPIDYDPLANIAEFVINYNQKHGTDHPEFYNGSYSQAVTEAKRDLKFLLVYIHQDDNKDSIQFASETFKNPDLIEYLRNNFITWGCSKNLPEGRKVFNALKARRCPFLGVIVLRSSRMNLVTRIEGPITAAELLLQLANIVSENEPELVAARHDREQRNQTQLIRQQQDQAYEESLKLDREKARKKQEQAEAERRAEELEKQKQEEELTRINRIMEKKSELRKLLSETPQPEASSPAAVKLLVKLPTGNRFERTFLKTDPLSELYKFVFSNEECPLNFEIVTNFPRKVIECDENTTQSIQDFGISQSMLLFVNDLDA